MGNYIKINTNRLHTDSETVAGLIRAMRTELSNMRQSVSQMDAMWDGPSSEAFKKAVQNDMDAMEAILKNLDGIQSFEANAKNKYDACENRIGGIVAGIRV